MSTGKRQKHWSDRVHESIVSRNQGGQLNLTIKGGAEECNFPYFGNVKQDKVIYHSGKIQDGELLLEVNDESVVGLTLYDLNDLIRKAKDPVRFKTVKEGSILTKDLKEYLGKRFQDKGSVDHQLQATIRDNLYVRTLPCTTRKPRDGEIDGVNYTFMSVEKFEQMEKNGDFLEHGYYDGNYYGTPKPAITPFEAAATAAAAAENSNEEHSNNIQQSQQQNEQHQQGESVSIASSGGTQSSNDNGKRRRRRSNVDLQTSGSNPQASTLEASQANSSSNNNLLMVTTKNKTNNNESSENVQAEKEETPVNGLSTTSLSDNQVNNTNSCTQPQPPDDIKLEPSVIVGSEVDLGPLPKGWEIATTDSGDNYFIDHIGKKTSWKDPRLDPAMRKKLEDCEDDELPNGWEKVSDSQYGTYYVDHLLKHTQFENPVLQAKGKLLQQEENSSSVAATSTAELTSAAVTPLQQQQTMQQLHHHDDMMLTSSNQHLNNGGGSNLAAEDVADSIGGGILELKFTNNPDELQGTTHHVPIEKSSRGFGFTIIGGDEPQEFLQIKCIVPNGPASITGNIFEGDVIVRVNDTCVLGWTHPDVVKLFQSISVGEIVTLELNRGYPLLVDPATSIVDTYAIKSDDKPMEEFERQLRMLNTHLEDPKVIEEIEPSLPNVYDEIPEYNSQYSASEYYPYTARPQHQLSRAASVNSIPPGPVVLQVIVEKGDKGFGFTVADSPQGQRVKHILDKQGCTDLLENDVLLEIDGTPVQCMPHNNVVDILKDYTRGDSAIMVIQRFPPQPVQYSPPQPPQQPLHMITTAGGGYAGNGGSVTMLPPRHPYQLSAGGGQLTQSYMHLPNTQLAPVQYEPKYMGHGNASTISAPCLPMQARNMIPAREQYLEHDSYIYGPPPHMQFDNASYQSDVMSRISDGAGEYIYLNVVLHREESGFGFRILGGNTDEVTIGAIVPGGAADREGTLKSGDRLLTVDGKRIARLGHNEVVSLMGSAARNNVVKLGISRRIVQQKTRANPRAAANWSQPSSHQNKSSYVMNAEVIPIVLHRKDGEGFGFVIISPNKVHDTNNPSVRSDPNFLYAPHKIGRITDDSPAAKCGQLRVDDRILAINRIDITNLHHPQIARIIKDSGFNIQLDVIPYRRGGGGGGSDVSAQSRHHHHHHGHHRPQMNNNKSTLFQVELKRSSAGFGFGIRGGKEYNLPLYVLRIADDGPAAMCGEIQVGDMLIEINDVNVTDIPHSKAISLIKDGGHTVRLLLKKGDGNVPELN